MIIILPAAGSGSRYGGDQPKQYDLIDDKSILEHTVHRLLNNPEIDTIVLVHAKNDNYLLDLIATNLALTDPRVRYCIGGESRAESVLNGLNYVSSNVRCCADTIVAVHDVVRPCFASSLLSDLANAVRENANGAIAAWQSVDTVKRSMIAVTENTSAELIEKTVARDRVWLAQTPQAFPFAMLHYAYLSAERSNALASITDEASAVEQFAHGKPTLVSSSRYNLKITLPEDKPIAAHLLAEIYATESPIL